MKVKRYGWAVLIIALVGSLTLAACGGGAAGPTNTPTPAATPTPSADAHFGSGMAYFQSEEYAQAAAEFEEATRLDPSNAQAYLYLGRSYHKQGEYEKAIAAYQEAIKLTPDDAEVYFYLGVAYDQQGNLDQAAEAYQEALRLDPNMEEAHNNLGGVYADQGEIDKAIAEYSITIQINPDNDAAHYNLGLLYHDQGLLEAAIAEYLASIEANPQQADAYYNLGIAYYDQGQLDKAIEAWQESIRIQPDDSMVHNNLGRAYYDQMRLEEAEAELNEAIRLDPTNALAHYNLGLVYLRQEEEQKAISEFEAFLQYADPDDPRRPLAENFLASVSGEREEYRNEVGGYSLLYPAGFAHGDDGEWSVFSPSETAMNTALSGDFGGGLSEGPLVMFDTLPLDQATADLGLEATASPGDIVRALAENMEAEVLGVDEGTINGLPAALADVTGTMDETSYQGFITVIIVEDRLFGIFAMAPPDQWESFDPIAWEMTKSLSFFAPTP